MSKPILALDLDGAVVMWFRLFYAVIEEMFGPLRVPYEEVDDPDFSVALGISRESNLAAVKVLDQRHPVDTLQFKPGARKALKVLSVKYRFAVITSRRDELVPQTEFWVRKNLPATPVYLSHAPRLEFVGTSGRRRKADIAEEIGAVCLIEDSPHELRDWPDNGVLPVCNARPWNRKLAAMRPDIPRLEWHQIAELLMGSDLKGPTGRP